MTTQTDLSAYREKFLDNFPVTETEIDRLLNLFSLSEKEQGHDDMGKEDASMASLCRQVQQQQQKEEQDVAPSSSGEEWLSTLQLVQEGILPEAKQWLMVQAPRHVMPLLPYDIPDDKITSTICRAFYFMEAIVSLLGRRGSRFLINFVYDMASSKSKEGETPSPKLLVDILYRHLMAALCLQELDNQKDNSKKSNFQLLTQQTADKIQPPKAWIHSLTKAAATGSIVSRPAWSAWITDVLPESMRGLSTFYHYALFPPGHPVGPNSIPQLSLPQPDKEAFLFGSNLLPLSLGCMSSVFCGPWYQLYSSNEDGLSFPAVQNALLGYSGPTVMIVRRKRHGNDSAETNTDGVFGFYTDCPWKESNAWFGGEGFDSFLFKLDDNDMGVHWPTWESATGNYMYLNGSPQNGTNHNPTTLKGLAIGGISNTIPRVHLTTSLEKCKATSTDTTFASGSLLQDESDGTPSSPFFDVDAIEVWAVNVSSEADFLQHRKCGQKQVTRKEDARIRAARVDRKQFVSDFQSGAFMNSLFSHRHEARGRHDFVAGDDSGSGYFVEDKPPSMTLAGEESTAEGGGGGGNETT